MSKAVGPSYLRLKNYPIRSNVRSESHENHSVREHTGVRIDPPREDIRNKTTSFKNLALGTFAVAVIVWLFNNTRSFQQGASGQVETRSDVPYTQATLPAQGAPFMARDENKAL
jgi:hypothetical protein